MSPTLETPLTKLFGLVGPFLAIAVKWFTGLSDAVSRKPQSCKTLALAREVMWPEVSRFKAWRAWLTPVPAMSVLCLCLFRFSCALTRVLAARGSCQQFWRSGSSRWFGEQIRDQTLDL